MSGRVRLALEEGDAVTTRAQTWIRPATILGLLLPLCGAGVLIHGPQRALAQTTPGTQVNVELMMDSSGSMAAATDTGEPRIDAAKPVLDQVIEAIPADRPEINVGFRVFGHKGNNTPAGRAESCQSSDLTVPVQGVDKAALSAQVANYTPVGWTPIGLSLERAGADFPAASDTVTNAIILVTDGLETCGADPCAQAKALKESDAAVTVYVVGLGLDAEELRITSCIADNTGGRIVGAQNASELSAALFTFLEELEVVVTTGIPGDRVDRRALPAGDADVRRAGASDTNPQGGEPFSYTFTAETNKVEAPVGVCDLAWTNPSGATDGDPGQHRGRPHDLRARVTAQVPAGRRRDLRAQGARRHGDLARPDRRGRLGVGAAWDLQLRSARAGG